MINKKFDHLGLVDTGRYWPSFIDNNRIPQIFRGHVMSYQLDSISAYNHHDLLSGAYQHGEII